MNDLVSVIMPSYNTGQYIAESIRSVLSQTYENWELLIVDDCSSDDTDAVVERIEDRRIRYLKNAENSGGAASRNRALREAKGRWIAFLDSDDLWLPEKLERQIRFMEKNRYRFSYTAYEEIDAAGKRTGVRVKGPKRITQRGMYNYCWPGCLTVMYDAERIGLIQVADRLKNDDYAMWLKVSRKEDCHLLEECLARYRRGRLGSVSSRGFMTKIGWHYKLFREEEQENPIHALANTGRNMLWGCYKKIRYVEKLEDLEKITQ
ncbi:Glycosyl transferase family 2 [[Clostridium] aminophilum]|uniref:Glycosyl transferase family 2 n=1 Tax=[Clostridium] aminophilum TaxID=1526 RepID=A0A1I0FMN2_9FIRM|nr:glycosyltransferase family 2 protein [[Clostridium] aminophilum]SET58747.1 Glycosyl transferase family 2 [[Clostridium] aminophilum]